MKSASKCKIINPFLSMYICPNCHKRHKMATKVCSYKCSKEYKNRSKQDAIRTKASKS
jgi:hypothetical protein